MTACAKTKHLAQSYTLALCEHLVTCRDART